MVVTMDRRSLHAVVTRPWHFHLQSGVESDDAAPSGTLIMDGGGVSRGSAYFLMLLANISHFFI